MYGCYVDMFLFSMVLFQDTCSLLRSPCYYGYLGTVPQVTVIPKCVVIREAWERDEGMEGGSGREMEGVRVRGREVRMEGKREKGEDQEE